MKNSLRYLKLWQKKRNELNVNDDQQPDWLEMNALLDQHMPVAVPPADEKPPRSKGFKLMSVLFVSLSAAAMTYVISYVHEAKKFKHHTHSFHAKHDTKLPADSAANSNFTDSVNANHAASDKNDSLYAIKHPGDLQNKGVADSGGAVNNAALTGKSGNMPSLDNKPNKNSSALTKNNNLLATSKQNKNQQADLTKQNSLAALNGQNKNQTSVLTKQNRLAIAGTLNKNQPGLVNYNGNKSKQSLAGSSQLGSNNARGNRRSGASQSSIINRNLIQHGNLNRQSNRNAGENNNQPTSGKADSAEPGYPFLYPPAPKSIFNAGADNFHPFSNTTVSLGSIQKQLSNRLKGNGKAGKNDKAPKTKNTATKNSAPVNLDWGILTGVNVSGSFTPKTQNSNFYGSSPVDLYFGLYANYNLNDKWAIGAQARLFNPQTIITTYNHANGSKIDSTQSLKITSSRKIYSVSIPVHIMYKATDKISIIGGPVVNLPVKQRNASTTLQPAAIKTDSNYYNKVDSVLSRTQYQQKLNFGISGGVNVQFKRLSFEATYLKSLSGYQVTSGYGTYKSHNGTLQFTIKFQLNKAKP